MTYEEGEVARVLYRHHLEQARSAAARLPEFEGAEPIRALNELLGLRPVRSKPPFLRVLKTWGRPEGDEAA